MYGKDGREETLWPAGKFCGCQSRDPSEPTHGLNLRPILQLLIIGYDIFMTVLDLDLN